MALSIYSLGDIGTLPSPSFGVGGAFVVFPGRSRVELGISYLLPRKTTFSSLSSAWADVDLLLGYASAGVVIKAHPKLELAPKFRFELGGLRAESFGVTNPDKASAMLVGMGIGGQGSMRLRRNIHLVFGVDGVLYIAYPRFIVTGLGEAHTPSRVVGRIALGGEWRF